MLITNNTHHKPWSPPILSGKQKCCHGNLWVLFPSRSVSVSHQIKAVINKMGLLVPSSLFSPSPFTLPLQHLLVSKCLQLCQFLSLFSFSPSGYHCGFLSAFPPAWIENFFLLLPFFLFAALSLFCWLSRAPGKWCMVDSQPLSNH